jgi:ribosome-associated toxin RatA of RatAB toxin-antitoxin module
MYSLIAFLAVFGTWEKFDEQGGYLVERRQVAGSQFPEVRVTTRSDLPPEAIFSVIWSHHTYTEFVPYLKKMEVLKTDGDKKLTYQQVNMPVVSDRDYTVLVERKVDPTNRVYETSFRAASEMGPPENERFVRVKHLRGSWTIVPDGDGSSIVYQVQTDPGGDLPAWIATTAQKTAAPALVRAMIERANKLNKKG